MKKLTLFTAMLITANMLFAQIIHIPADYPTIQEGVNAANDGDTVLVHPGTYYENVTIENKSLTLASLFLTTQDTSYVSQTLIYGNQGYSAVLDIFTPFPQPLKTVSIYGFTIRNGFYGIHCNRAIAIIQNAVIQNNQHGIVFYSSNLWLEDMIVKYNGTGIRSYSSSAVFKSVTVTANSNGGVDFQYSIPVFDSLKRCNIYHNSGWGLGNDIEYLGGSGAQIQVYLDTFSVVNPRSYHAYPLNQFAFHINHGLLEQVEADLFVSPDGDDANSGLTPDEPLKRINIANSKIISDSMNQRTIHLLPGIYSPSVTGEIFPVSLPEHVNLSGVSREQVVLDAEVGSSLPSRQVLRPSSNVRISGMTLTGGSCGIVCIGLNNVIMEQLIITGNSGGFVLPMGAGAYISNCIDCLFHDVIISDNIVQHEDFAFGGGIYCEDSNPIFQNVTISNNTATSPSDEVYGGGIYCSNASPIFENCVFTNNSAIYGGAVSCWNGSSPVFRNVLFAGNNYGNNWGEGSVLFMSTNGNNPCYPSLINCTMTDNYATWGIMGSHYYIIDCGNYPCSSNVTVINSISWYNGDGSEWFSYLPYSSVSYSNVGGGQAGIGNINMEPLFLGTGEHPYQLSPGSPCIDAGTPDTTGLNLPLMDLLGNHRIWDGDGDGIARIDMGAYEFDSPIFVGIPQSQIRNRKSEIIVFPNPFTIHTTIEFNLPQTSTVSIKIFNAMGAKVAGLHHGQLPAGQQRFMWDAGDLPKGMYFCRVQAGNELTTRKMIKY